MGIINDGRSKGPAMGVNDNFRGLVNAITEQESEAAALLGDGYNINTDYISYTTGTSGAVYVLNNEDEDFFVDSIIVGTKEPVGGTLDDIIVITMIKNATTGTLISTATAIAIKENRNFGSSKTATNLIAYMGADGETVTDGTTAAVISQKGTGRSVTPIGWIVPKAKSFSLTLGVTLSAGSIPIYVAVVGHFLDPKRL